MRLVIFVVSVSLLARLSFAQSDRGAVTGTVVDQSNAVIPNALVSLQNVATSATYQTATTLTGNYTVQSLPPGIYSLTAEAPGFRKFVQTGIVVEVAKTDRVDITLEVGTPSESVNVTAQASMLNTEDAEQSHSMSGIRINSLPLNFSMSSGGYIRSPFQFINMEPGATNTGQNVIRVNGMPNSSQTMYIEGQDATNTNSAARIDELQPSIEAIEATTLQTSNFAPEFGQIIGGLFNYNAKSGTNEFHGSLYECFANEALNAGLTDTNDGHGHHILPRDRKNDFGFSLGGPIRIPHMYNGKNRSFFFFAWEFYRDRRVISGTYITVPTIAMRAGNFSNVLGSALGKDPTGQTVFENEIFDPATANIVNGVVEETPFSNNTIPASRLDPVAVKIQSLIPLPQNSGFVNNYQQIYPTARIQGIPSIKLDEQITANGKLSFYWSQFRTDQYVNPDGLPSPLTSLRILYERNETMRLNYDYIVSPRFLIHAGAGYIMYRNPDVAISSVLSYNAPQELGLLGGVPTDLLGKGSLATGFPELTGLLSSTGYGGFGGTASNVLGPTNANLYAVDKPTGVFNASFVHGSHTFKFGADWRIDAYRDRNVRGSWGIWNFRNVETDLPSAQGVVPGSASEVGFPYASFLLGAADTASVQTEQDPQFRKTSWSLFGQDNWKASHKLTITYGLRWDLQGAPNEIFDRLAEFSPTTPNPSAGGLLGATIYEGFGPGRCQCNFTHTYPYAIGPRLGIAYQITPKTVFRGGWGFTYGTTTNFNYISNTPIIGFSDYNNLTFVAPAFGQPAARLAQGLPYTEAQLYPVMLNPGIRPSPGQINSPPYFIDPNGGRPPRINQWNISLQRSITGNFLIEAAYVGNRGVWLQANNLIDLNALTPQKLASVGLNLNNSVDRTLLTDQMNSPAVAAAGFSIPYTGFPVTQTLAQALRPYPQFGNIPVEWAPLGNDWYDSLQVKATHRLSHGLDVQYSFTWQKELTTAENTTVNDVFNRPVQKAISAYSLPLISAISFTYQTPALSANRFLRAMTGNWTFGGILRYQSGLPIQTPYATNNLIALLPRNVPSNVPNITYANPTGQPFFLVNPNCKCFDPNKQFVLNPAAWSEPGPGQWGVGAPYYNDYRWQRQPAESLSLGRIFTLREKLNFSIRAEFFNVFNRVFYNPPTNTPASLTQNFINGVPVSGFGYVNTSAVAVQTGGAVPTERNGQIVARFQW